MSKPSLLVISHVKPFPLSSGQQMRVHNKLIALKQHFDITFLTYDVSSKLSETRTKLTELVPRCIVLPSLSNGNWGHRASSYLYSIVTGLKRSNYLIGQTEFSAKRLLNSIQISDYDVVLYEYWHAHQSTAIFRNHGIPCVLDMHDLLWQSYNRQVSTRPYLLLLRPYLVNRYKMREEAAWHDYDLLIAISAGEGEYVRRKLPSISVIDAPMGIDVDKWSYRWEPSCPPRIGFYGGMGSQVNQDSALRCVNKIMPLIWERLPDVEFWIIGSNPPPHICELEKHDRRIRVTGFVEDIQSVLQSLTLKLCPWSGKYGFRSRIIEVMALGVPVVVTPDAVHGMGLIADQGVLFGENDNEMADQALKLLTSDDAIQVQSNLARQTVLGHFSFEATYGRLATELMEFVMRFDRASGR